MQLCSCIPSFSLSLAHRPSINGEMEGGAASSPCLWSNMNMGLRSKEPLLRGAGSVALQASVGKCR